MSGAVGLSSVNCTSCGAGLSVLGGGRVLTHVCGYCGAVLDTQDEYKTLNSIGKRNHPNSPIQIGMTIPIDGVTFTVIGTIGKHERWGGGSARWVEHQIFSETHGYAWLSYEGGQFTFTRKVRDFNMDHWMSVREVESAEVPPKRNYRGQNYKYYETSNARIDFMEGEFNWIPKIDEKTTTITLLGPDDMLSMRMGATEKEVEVTRLLDRDEVIQSMGLERVATPIEMHPLAPYEPLAEEGFMRRTFGLSALVAMMLAFVLALLPGTSLLRERASVEAPQTFTFNVSDASQLISLQYTVTNSRSWTILDSTVQTPSGGVAVRGQTLLDRGDQPTGTLRFRTTETGPHQLSLSRVSGVELPEVRISATQGQASAFWVIVAAIVFGVAWFFLVARRSRHERHRYAGSDWHED